MAAGAKVECARLAASRRSPVTTKLGHAMAALMLLGLIAGAGNAIAQRPASPASPASTADWAKIVEAAKKEGRVALYSSQVPPVLTRMKADFENAYPGIALEYSRYPSGMLNRIDAERQSGADGADMAIATEVLVLAQSPGFNDGVQKGLFAVPVGPSMAAWPSTYLVNRAAVILALEPIVMAYNTNAVKTPLTGYPDLLRPEFKGRIGASELAATAVIAWYSFVEKTQGANFLAQFAAQQPKMYVGAVPNAQAVASGEIAVTAFTNTTTALPLVELGAPIRVVVPKPGFGIRYAGVIVGGSKRPNAAQVLMNYLMSVRGQVMWTGRGDAASPLPNIPGSIDVNTIVPFEPSAFPPEVTKAFQERWNGLFKK